MTRAVFLPQPFSAARACVRFGVPDLYILNPIEDCALTAADWEELRAVWDAYRRAQEG